MKVEVYWDCAYFNEGEGVSGVVKHYSASEIQSKLEKSGIGQLTLGQKILIYGKIKKKVIGFSAVS